MGEYASISEKAWQSWGAQNLKSRPEGTIGDNYHVINVSSKLNPSMDAGCALDRD
jgi:hypothetical protein